MDILKARKKATERKQARKKKEPAQPPVAESMQEETARLIETAPVVSVPVSGIPVSEVVFSAREELVLEAPFGEEASETQTQEIELLSFQLGTETYAIPVKDVREVLKNRLLTRVPNTPAYIPGVTSLRGTILPVIDLCKRLEVVPGMRDEKSRIVVVGFQEEPVGLIVDRIMGVVKIMPDDVKPAPENIEQSAALLHGIVRKEDRLFILLDLEKALGT